MHFTVPNFTELMNVEWNHIEIFYTEFYPNQDSKMEIMGKVKQSHYGPGQAQRVPGS